MFLIRIRPLYLFLLMMLPAIASAVLAQAPSFAGENALRMQVLGVNLSSLFAVVITAWIITVTVALAPGKVSRALIIAGMAGSMLFRTWQNNWAIDELNGFGTVAAAGEPELLSPLFVLNALSSAMMLLTLVLLSFWLVRKEKAEQIPAPALWITIVQFLLFPVGLFWIQKRMQLVCPDNEANTEA